MLAAYLSVLPTARADLIGYWPFDDGAGDVAVDKSGSDNHGMLTETAAFTADGKFGGALNLGDLDNGAAVLLNDAAQGENGAAGFNSIIKTQNVTISFWMNREGAEPTNQWTFLFQNDAGQRQLGSHAPWSDGSIYWDVASDADGCCNADNRISVPLGSAATNGEWHHLAYRKLRPDGENLGQTSIWVDGASIKESDGFIIADISELTGASIGGNNGGGNSQNGLIDEFAIWDEALSDADIVALSQGAPVLPLPEPLGDFNGDKLVDTADFLIMAANFGLKFSREESITKGDFNGDTRVNLKDFLGFRMLINSQQGATAAVPEPSSLALLGIIGGWFLARRRRVVG